METVPGHAMPHIGSVLEGAIVAASVKEVVTQEIISPHMVHLRIFSSIPAGVVIAKQGTPAVFFISLGLLFFCGGRGCEEQCYCV